MYIKREFGNKILKKMIFLVNKILYLLNNLINDLQKLGTFFGNNNLNPLIFFNLKKQNH